MRQVALAALIGVLIASPLLAPPRRPRDGDNFGPLAIGDSVPDVSAFAANGEKLTLRGILKDHYSVVVFGCLTCPWHGYQYNPEDGTSPEPFTEKIPTFNVKVRAGTVWVDPTPNPAGSKVEPAII